MGAPELLTGGRRPQKAAMERRVTRAAAKTKALETLEQVLGEYRHEAVFRCFSVVELWRLRRVCRAFRRWGTAALAALPRVLAVGGMVSAGNFETTAGVEVLDLSALRWSSGVVPALPEPRQMLAACSFGDGRVVVAGGDDRGDEPIRATLEWVRGAASWAPLPELTDGRGAAAAVALPDGRAVVIGGWDGDNERAFGSAEVLAVDGSGWSLAPVPATSLTPMGTARFGHAAAVLPCGKVLVAGGATALDHGSALNTAALWDPATGMWSELPAMAQQRIDPGCCVLPSGRLAVVGGLGSTGSFRRDGEAFDPEARTWQLLPPMAHARAWHGLVAVAGGMLAVGGAAGAPNELFDEASGRWFELPHPMAEPRSVCPAVLLPASALAPPAAGAAAAGAAAVAQP